MQSDFCRLSGARVNLRLEILNDKLQFCHLAPQRLTFFSEPACFFTLACQGRDCFFGNVALARGRQHLSCILLFRELLNMPQQHTHLMAGFISVGKRDRQL